MNTHWLDEAMPSMIGIWHAQPLANPFFSKIKALTKYIGRFAKKKLLNLGRTFFMPLNN